MAIYRITGASRLLACSLLICAAVVHGPRTSFAQTADSSAEQTQNAEPQSGTVGFSEQARENQQQPQAQDVAKIRVAVSAGFPTRPGLKPRNSGMD